ncbi:MAG: hypothetical protein WCR20_21490 [Verrucomicrobiota bacterium]
MASFDVMSQIAQWAILTHSAAAMYHQTKAEQAQAEFVFLSGLPHSQRPMHTVVGETLDQAAVRSTQNAYWPSIQGKMERHSLSLEFVQAMLHQLKRMEPEPEVPVPLGIPPKSHLWLATSSQFALLVFCPNSFEETWSNSVEHSKCLRSLPILQETAHQEVDRPANLHSIDNLLRIPRVHLKWTYENLLLGASLAQDLSVATLPALEEAS